MRNGTALAGVVLLGWSAQSLLALYFVDTMAGCWACLSAVMAWVTGADRVEGFWSGVHSLVSSMLGALLIVPFLAVPLAMPLVFTLGDPGRAWRELWADPSFALGVAVIVLTAAVTTVRHLLALGQGETGEAGVKQAFAIAFTRWMLVLIVGFWAAGLLGRLASYLLVAVYAAASAWSELQPERFAHLFPDRRAPGAPGPDRRPRGRR